MVHLLWDRLVLLSTEWRLRNAWSFEGICQEGDALDNGEICIGNSQSLHFLFENKLDDHIKPDLPIFHQVFPV